MERRHLAPSAPRLEKRGAEGAANVLTGYASVFYDAADPGTEYKIDSSWGSFRERVLPGAFDRALKDGDDCRALFNHDPNQILGRTGAGTCRLAVDARGLRYEVDIPDTTVGRDLVVSLQRGDVTGSSFGFLVNSDAWTEGKTDDKPYSLREIKSVKLYDVSPVTYPAYPATSAGTRAAGEVEEAKAGFLAWLEKRKSSRAGDPNWDAWAALKARAVDVTLRLEE